MAPPRYVCIHGHFYQPPRENPWLEAVEVQDSAAPYHDWNERITHECYAPNSRSRLVDGQGRIINLLNNYAWMSFNFGPTLLAWTREAAPEVAHGIAEGDRLSRERRHGHGNAIAQVYNHAILPLADANDRRTQVLWGVADFRRQFGREPEGMWVAETAADTASLEALAAAGVRFTVLAPRQAKRWRRVGDEDWTSIPEGIDPSRAYLCRLPSGRTITLFFYDGAISRQVAFEGLLDSGEKFLARLLGGFDDRRPHAQLVHIATDGESYGHHHAHGDMALAYVLDRLSRHPDVRLTNYGEYLELHPPEWEVEIHDNSSWSCVHGVERWRSNCGCNMGRGWHQEWRGPLRDALNGLKEELDHLFTTKGRECFPDPWKARDAYIAVILDRREEAVRNFFREEGHPDLDNDLIREGLWLLEMQRNAMLMFTSCGWFFDEVSGLETTQCLRYAGRAIQLATHFNRHFEEGFVKALEKAPSNLPQFKNARGVWEQLVRPDKIELDRVLAHYAISLIYRAHEAESRVYCYDLKALDQEIHSRGGSHVAVGRLQARSRLTWNQADTNFVVVHYGGLDFHAVLRKAAAAPEYEGLKQHLFRTYTEGSLADVTRLVMDKFPGEPRRLEDLFLEEQRRVIGIVLQERFEDYQATFERLASQDDEVLGRLARLHYPIPKPMRAAASLYLDRRLREETDRLGAESGVAHVQKLLEQGRAWGYQPERERVRKLLDEELQDVFVELGPAADLEALAARASALLDAAGLFEVRLDLWQAQNRLLEAFAQLTDSQAMSPPLKEAFARLAAKLNVNPELLGWRP